MITVTTGEEEAVNLLKSMRMPTREARLDSGDACFLGKGPTGIPLPVGLEWKSIGGFIRSVVSGRLVGHQVPKMANHYERSYILVTGIFRIVEDRIQVYQGGWRPILEGQCKYSLNHVLGVLHGLEEFFGIRFRFAADMRGAMEYLRYLYLWWQKEYDTHGSCTKIHYSPPIPDAILVDPPLRVKLAAQLPGVGPALASRVIPAFPDSRSMLNANSWDWESIHGIGPKRALEITRRVQLE